MDPQRAKCCWQGRMPADTQAPAPARWRARFQAHCTCTTETQIATHNGAARPAHGFQRADDRRLLGNERDDRVENEKRAQNHRQNGQHAQQRKDAVDGVDALPG